MSAHRHKFYTSHLSATKRLSRISWPCFKASPKRLFRDRCCIRSMQVCENEGLLESTKNIACSLVATLASVHLLCSAPLAHADVQTVAPKDATTLARTLPKQQVNKGKIWLLFLAGATALFGAAVAVERNASLFPAISKANKAMAASREAALKKKAEGEEYIDAEASSTTASEEAVLQGLADARANTQEGAASSTSSEVSAESQDQPSPGSDGDAGSLPTELDASSSKNGGNGSHRDKVTSQSSSAD